MSRASKLTLAATGLGTAGIVYFVHWAQEQDRAVRAITEDVETRDNLICEARVLG